MADFDKEDSEQTKNDLELLSTFINKTFKSDSILYNECRKLIQSITLKQEKHIFQKSMLILNLQLNLGSTSVTSTTTIPVESTLLDLKANIESKLPTGSSVERLKVLRTGRAIGTFDTRKVSTCDISNNEQLVVDCMSFTQASARNFDKSLKGLTRVPSSQIRPSNAVELLTVAIHCALLDYGFVCMVEQGKSTAGFAASLRELPQGVLLPHDWNSASKIVITYKHKAKLGKQFELQVSGNDKEIKVNLGFKNTKNTNETVTRKLLVSSFLNVVSASDSISKEDSGGVLSGDTADNYLASLLSNFIDYGALCDSAREMIAAICPEAAVTPAIPTESAETTLPLSSSNAHYKDVRQQPPSQRDDKYEQYQRQQEQEEYSSPGQFANNPNPLSPQKPSESFPRPPYAPSQPSASIHNTGRDDLDPFSGAFQPRSGEHPLIHPGGGSQVGPNHPMFNNPDDYNNSDEYYGDPNSGDNFFFPNGGGIGGDGNMGRLPQPRFDPFGPVTGPNSGVDVGNVGGGRDMGGRGGRGAAGRNRPFPGEPNPDHLKPPGW